MKETNQHHLFQWDDGNLGHIDFDYEEVEEALLDPDRIVADAYNMNGEQRRALLGATEAGEILFVVFTYRGDLIRVIAARNATKREQRRYRQRGK